MQVLTHRKPMPLLCIQWSSCSFVEDKVLEVWQSKDVLVSVSELLYSWIKCFFSCILVSCVCRWISWGYAWRYARNGRYARSQWDSQWSRSPGGHAGEYLIKIKAKCSEWGRNSSCELREERCDLVESGGECLLISVVKFSFCACVAPNSLESVSYLSDWQELN